jgi:hypothetical protein
LPREIELPEHEYIGYLLRHVSPRFAADSQFVFFMLNKWLRKNVSSSVSFVCNANIGNTTALLQSLDASELQDPWSAAFARMKATIQKLSAKSRGSNGSKKEAQRDSLALMRERGPPTLFLTLSSPEIQDRETQKAHFSRRVLFEHPSQRTVLSDTKLSASDRQKLCVNHPVECSLAFQARIDAMICHRRNKTIWTNKR